MDEWFKGVTHLFLSGGLSGVQGAVQKHVA